MITPIQKKILVSTGIAILIIAFLFNFTEHAPAADESIQPLGNVSVVTETGESGEADVNFSWENADGISNSLSEYRGKVVLINFWATWCVPCRREIPYLIDINNELDDNEYVTIGISVDDPSDIEKVNIFIEDQNINYLNILDDGRLTRQFGSIRAIPTTIIIDQEGTVQETIVGIRTKEQFLEKIKKYL